MWYGRRRSEWLELDPFTHILNIQYSVDRVVIFITIFIIIIVKNNPVGLLVVEKLLSAS